MIIDSYGKLPFLIGKSTANVPFSIAMLNYQRVLIEPLGVIEIMFLFWCLNPNRCGMFWC
jgi:hypothetical protein